MAASKEILSFEDLRKLRLADEGYIVITGGHAVIHRVNSKCITADNFNTKVSINDRKQGSYFWVDSISTATHEFSARRCKACKPELHFVLPSTFDT